MSVIADAVGTPATLQATLAPQFAAALVKYAALPQVVAMITAFQTMINAQIAILISDGVTTKANIRLSGSAQGPAVQSKSMLANNMNFQLVFNPSYK